MEKYSRQSDDTKIQPVPRISQVRTHLDKNFPCQYLYQGFKGINDSEDIPGREGGKRALTAPWRELKGRVVVIVPKESVQRASPRWGRRRGEAREMRRRWRNSGGRIAKMWGGRNFFLMWLG